MKLLLVEDNHDLAEVLSEALKLEKYDVVHAATLKGAFLALDDGYRPDGAMLDVNVDGRTVFDVADHLDAAGIPFFFASAARREEIPYRFAARQLLGKPYTLEGLCDALRHILRGIISERPQHDGRAGTSS